MFVIIPSTGLLVSVVLFLRTVVVSYQDSAVILGWLLHMLRGMVKWISVVGGGCRQ